MNDMKKRLVDAIKGCNELCRECDCKSCEGCFLLSEYDKEADALLLAGVLVPPVKIGDTVYAVVELDDGAEVAEYTVSGVAYSNGAWYACANDIEFNKVGDRLCLLTREEAEELVREMREEKDASSTAAAVPQPLGREIPGYDIKISSARIDIWGVGVPRSYHGQRIDLCEECYEKFVSFLEGGDGDEDQ